MEAASSLDVVAFPRRHGVFLAAALGPDPEAPAKLLLCAEDGARFALPADIVILRVAGLDDRVEGEGVPEWLARLRRRLPTVPRWEEIHGLVDEGACIGITELAERAGLTGDVGRLALTTALGESSPWFRIDGETLTAVPGDQARAELVRVEEERRIRDENQALVAWWPRRDDEEPPSGAAEPVRALGEFALRGVDPRTERGRALAMKLDRAEPDHLLEELVRLGVLPDEVNPAAYRAGVEAPFDDAAVASAATPLADAREDLRHLLAVAVDDVHTDDPDDAISVREVDGRTEVLVHITDVAAAIPNGGALDLAARARGGTLYVPDGPVPMLPRDLSNERLALTPGPDRLALTAVFAFGADGEIVESRVVRSVVSVARRVTYDESRDTATLAGTPALARRLVGVCEALRKRRVESGARILGLPSLKVTLRGGLQAVLRRHGTPGDLVVAEAMVLYNREAARRLAAAGAPALFRTQVESDRPFPSPGDPLFPLLVRRAFARTHLATGPAEHRGIGGGPYVQVTSPLRRYGDLVNQRQLAALADGTEPPHGLDEVERIVEWLSGQERRLRGAADSRASYWLARYFEERVGEQLEGVLSRAPRRGRGGVWVPSLCRELPLIAPRGWRPPALGTSRRFRVARVRPWRGRIELEPVD